MNMTTLKEQLYLAFDVETDGSNPLLNNMFSIGMAGILKDKSVVFEYQANIQELPDHKPDSSTMAFWTKPENIAVFNQLHLNSRHYMEVFKDISDHLNKLSEKYIIQFVAYPSCFDWMFFKCYYELFKSNSDDHDTYNLGYSCEDTNTLWNVYEKTHRLSWEDELEILESFRDVNDHKHEPLSDAKTQGKFHVHLLHLLNII